MAEGSVDMGFTSRHGLCFFDDPEGDIGVMGADGRGGLIDHDERLSLAALCLNGQTFGFTQNDLDVVECGVLAIKRDGCPLVAAELQSVLDRLAALLPTEGC